MSQKRKNEDHRAHTQKMLLCIEFFTFKEFIIWVVYVCKDVHVFTCVCQCAHTYATHVPHHKCHSEDNLHLSWPLLPCFQAGSLRCFSMSTLSLLACWLPGVLLALEVPGLHPYYESEFYVTSRILTQVLQAISLRPSFIVLRQHPFHGYKLK